MTYILHTCWKGVMSKTVSNWGILLNLLLINTSFWSWFVFWEEKVWHAPVNICSSPDSVSLIFVVFYTQFTLLVRWQAVGDVRASICMSFFLLLLQLFSCYYTFSAAVPALARSTCHLPGYPCPLCHGKLQRTSPALSSHHFSFPNTSYPAPSLADGHFGAMVRFWRVVVFPAAHPTLLHPQSRCQSQQGQLEVAHGLLTGHLVATLLNNLSLVPMAQVCTNKPVHWGGPSGIPMKTRGAAGGWQGTVSPGGNTVAPSSLPGLPVLIPGMGT